MLDFDFRRVPRLRPIWAVCRIVHLTPRAIETRRTNRGWHLTIMLREKLSPAATVALQAIMGSDQRREALNLMRVLAIERRDPGAYWRNRWNLLFHAKLP